MGVGKVEELSRPSSPPSWGEEALTEECPRRWVKPGVSPLQVIVVVVVVVVAAAVRVSCAGLVPEGLSGICGWLRRDSRLAPGLHD